MRKRRRIVKLMKRVKIIKMLKRMKEKAKNHKIVKKLMRLSLKIIAAHQQDLEKEDN
jgi:hypothetical protein